jgi:hypothetical protein
MGTKGLQVVQRKEAEGIGEKRSISNAKSRMNNGVRNGIAKDVRLPCGEKIVKSESKRMTQRATKLLQ